MVLLQGKVPGCAGWSGGKSLWTNRSLKFWPVCKPSTGVVKI